MKDDVQPQIAFLEGADYERLVAARSRVAARLAKLVQLIAVVGLAGIALLLFLYPQSNFQQTSWLKNAVIITAASMALIGVIHAALTYLEPRGSQKSRPTPFDMMFLGWQLARLRRSGTFKLDSPVAPVTKDEFQQIVEMLTARVQSETTAKLSADVHADFLNKVRRQSLDQRFSEMSSRLQRETADLARRGNLNLVLGMITTLGGLAVLGYAVVTAPSSSSYSDLIAHFVPRFSLALLIEVFAYFFLKLYKESLGGIKYFQNELTNVESKHIALEAALDGSTPELRALVVQSLCGTERNFVLAKDQTTIELERERLDRDTAMGLADQLKQMLKREKVKEE
jgi:hypothetical protein